MRERFSFRRDLHPGRPVIFHTLWAAMTLSRHDNEKCLDVGIEAYETYGSRGMPAHGICVAFHRQILRYFRKKWIDKSYFQRYNLTERI